MRDYLALAYEQGFTNAAYFDPQEVSFADAEVLREACRANDCGFYGKFWTCPPAVGTIEQCVNTFKSYRHGIILQLISEAVSSVFNPEFFSDISNSFNTMSKALKKEMEKEYADVYLLGMSGCNLCKNCNYPEKKCRKAQEMVPCISGHCVNVFKIWNASGHRQANLDESDFYSILLY